MFTRSVLLLTFLIVAFPVQAKDRISTSRAELSVFRNGVEQNLSEDGQVGIIKRIASMFNKNNADTTSIWYLQSVEYDGVILADKWDALSEGSYFHLNYPKKKSTLKSRAKKKSKRADIAEVIVTINESHEGSAFGLIFAKLREGEVRSYRVKGLNMINLYCFDKALPYLPVHYSTLSEKYSAPEYKDSGVQCSGELKKQTPKKKKKK